MLLFYQREIMLLFYRRDRLRCYCHCVPKNSMWYPFR